MSTPCNNFVVPIFEEDTCQGTRTNAACVVDESLYSELGLSENATQQQINQAQYLAAINQKATTDNLQTQVEIIDGSETKVEAGDGIEIIGIGTTGSPYIVSSSAISGTYTPVLTNVVNTSGIVSQVATFTKIDNIVTVRVALDFEIIAINTPSQLRISLPFNAATIQAPNLGSGCVNPLFEQGQTAIIQLQDATTATCTFFTGAILGSHIGAVIFQYIAV